MAFIRGTDTVVLVGSNALTGYLTQASVSKGAQAVNVSTFGNDQEAFIAGLEEGSLSLNGLFDATPSDSKLEAMLDDATGTAVTLGVGGTTIGNRCALVNAREVSYQVSAPVNDAVRLTASFTGDGPVRWGKSFHALGAETTSGNYASVDNTSSTANGGVGQLHVTAFTGTNCVVKIQDSTDDAVWNDLITFTTATGVTSERLTVAGTVDRYVRAQIASGTFTSITFAVSFARHLH